MLVLLDFFLHIHPVGVNTWKLCALAPRGGFSRWAEHFLPRTRPPPFPPSRAAAPAAARDAPLVSEKCSEQRLKPPFGRIGEWGGGVPFSEVLRPAAEAAARWGLPWHRILTHRPGNSLAACPLIPLGEATFELGIQNAIGGSKLRSGVNYNWMIAHGLRRYGHGQDADRLLRKTKCSPGIHPHQVIHDYGWSATLYLDIWRTLFPCE
jgi:hypothetical protein